MENSYGDNGFLSGKLFKFKMTNGTTRKFGDSIVGNAFTQLINLEPSQAVIGTE